MSQSEAKDALRTQVVSLQSLLSHLEECEELGAGEYLQCQSKIREVIGKLRWLERHLGSGKAPR